MTLGPHSPQTPMELLGFLIGLRVYCAFFRRRQRVPVVRGDLAAALGCALLLKKGDVGEVQGSHIPGKINVHVEYLPRPPFKLPPPEAPREVNIKQIKALQPFLLPGPGSRPDFWGRERPQAEQNRPESPALHRDTSSSSSWE